MAQDVRIGDKINEKRRQIKTRYSKNWPVVIRKIVLLTNKILSLCLRKFICQERNLPINL